GDDRGPDGVLPRLQTTLKKPKAIDLRLAQHAERIHHLQNSAQRIEDRVAESRTKLRAGELVASSNPTRADDLGDSLMVLVRHEEHARLEADHERKAYAGGREPRVAESLIHVVDVR